MVDNWTEWGCPVCPAGVYSCVAGLVFYTGRWRLFLYVLYWQENVIVVSDRYRIQAMDTGLEEDVF